MSGTASAPLRGRLSISLAGVNARRESSRSSVYGFLARERYSGRRKPAELLAKLRSAPEGRVGELELSTRRQLVLTLVATIRTLNAQIKELV